MRLLGPRSSSCDGCPEAELCTSRSNEPGTIVWQSSLFGVPADLVPSSGMGFVTADTLPHCTCWLSPCPTLLPSQRAFLQQQRVSISDVQSVLALDRASVTVAFRSPRHCLQFGRSERQFTLVQSVEWSDFDSQVLPNEIESVEGTIGSL